MFSDKTQGSVKLQLCVMPLAELGALKPRVDHLRMKLMEAEADDEADEAKDRDHDHRDK